MRSNKDVEAYLLRMERAFDEASPGTYVVRVGGVPVALKIDAPLVIARVDIGAIGQKADRRGLFEHLLRLNAKELVHCAYGLDGETILLSAALELENLDYNELDAVFAELDLALAQQLPRIRELAGQAS
jgi:Tir chaperone protein (CesT) family